MKKVILFTISTILLSLAGSKRAFALSVPIQTLGESKNLSATHHEIRIHQAIRDLEEEGQEPKKVTFYYDIKEEITLKNTGDGIFQDPLLFWGDISDDDADEVSLELTKNTQSTTVDDFTVENKQIKVPLTEENYISPGESIQILLKYRVFFVSQGQEEKWEKKIFYNHEPESLSIKFNPVGSAGFRPTALKIDFKESQTEDGLFESDPLSPEKIGKTYVISTVKETSASTNQQQTTQAPVQEESSVEEIQKTTPEEQPVNYPEGDESNTFLIVLVGLNIILIIGAMVYTVGFRG